MVITVVPLVSQPQVLLCVCVCVCVYLHNSVLDVLIGHILTVNSIELLSWMAQTRASLIMYYCLVSLKCSSLIYNLTYIVCL